MEEHLPKVIIEKRRHKMYVTRNTEYHVKDDVCVGIRNVRNGDWILQSKVLGAKLIAALSALPQTAKRVSEFIRPKEGDNLVFLSMTGEDIVTTKIREVSRPPKHVIQYYLALA
jgi:hypothetical protein